MSMEAQNDSKAPDDYEIATGALARVAGILTNQEADIRGRWAEMFRPYRGDNWKEARERGGTRGVCGNCCLVYPLCYGPADQGLARKAATRHSICPRCYSTTVYLHNEIEDPVREARG